MGGSEGTFFEKSGEVDEDAEEEAVVEFEPVEVEEDDDDDDEGGVVWRLKEVII